MWHMRLQGIELRFAQGLNLTSELLVMIRTNGSWEENLVLFVKGLPFYTRK